jgi:hypothetical protein
MQVFNDCGSWPKFTFLSNGDFKKFIADENFTTKVDWRREITYDFLMKRQ